MIATISKTGYSYLTVVYMSLVFAPILSVFFWPSTYVVYAALLIPGLLTLLRYGPAGDGFLNAVILIKSLVLVVMIGLHPSDSTILNVCAVLISDLAIWAYFSRPLDPAFDVVRFWKNTLLWLCFAIAIAAAISLAANGRWEISNPISDLADGSRLRLLAKDSGHSMLIDYGCTVLIILLSNIARLGPPIRWCLASVAILMLILTRTAQTYLMVSFVVFVFISETWIKSTKQRLAFYLIIVTGFAALIQLGDIDDVGRFIRVTVMRQPERTDMDYSSGRTKLNELLFDVSKDDPLVGTGNDNMILEYGTSLFNPNAIRADVAITESSLRLAVKYGYFYFLVVLAFVLSPIRCIGSTNAPIRILGVSFSGMTIISMTANSPMEIPHSYSYLLTNFVVYAAIMSARLTSRAEVQAVVSVSHIAPLSRSDAKT